MKKLVQENLTENWVSTDTGAQLYNDNPNKNDSNPYTASKEVIDDYHRTMNADYEKKKKEMDKMMTDDEKEIKKLIPSPTEKLTPEVFSEYINFLITEVAAKNPMFALNIFKEVMKLHPYLSKKPIGFINKTNPYEPYIQKFMEFFKNISK